LWALAIAGSAKHWIALAYRHQQVVRGFDGYLPTWDMSHERRILAHVEGAVVAPIPALHGW
jgi:hypothetical protein